MTRAMKQLYLTYAEQRRLHGVDSYGAPSRFIQEMPAELIEEIRPRVQVSTAAVRQRWRRFRPEDARRAGRMRLGAAFATASSAKAWCSTSRARPARARPGQLRTPGHKMADAAVCESRAVM